MNNRKIIRGDFTLIFTMSLGISIKEYKRHCYDGAANMQSAEKDGSSVISKDVANAIMTLVALIWNVQLQNSPTLKLLSLRPYLE